MPFFSTISLLLLAIYAALAVGVVFAYPGERRELVSRFGGLLFLPGPLLILGLSPLWDDLAIDAGISSRVKTSNIEFADDLQGVALILTALAWLAAGAVKGLSTPRAALVKIVASCPECGYEMTSAGIERCPECGRHDTGFIDRDQTVRATEFAARFIALATTLVAALFIVTATIFRIAGEYPMLGDIVEPLR
ncbi:MAG: hypothetical protein AAGJ54_09340 [Planctomycetota bacterium]